MYVLSHNFKQIIFFTLLKHHGFTGGVPSLNDRATSAGKNEILLLTLYKKKVFNNLSFSELNLQDKSKGGLGLGRCMFLAYSMNFKNVSNCKELISFSPSIS